MDANELKQLIQLGESESLEFKKSLTEQADAIKTAVAFANGNETLPAIGAKWEDLDHNSLERFLAARAPRAWQSGADLVDRAITDKLALRAAEGVVPTIAGVLAFCATPQQLNPVWGITALMFRGREFQREALLLRQDLTGSASALIDAAVAFVARNMRTFPIFPSDQVKRIDITEYDLAAVREAVANAVAHRDYRANEPIQIRLFDDRVEIQSPGPLPSDLTIARILAGGITRARNPILAQILLANGYMEQAGFGIVFIRQQMEKLGAPKPDFESGLAHFLVRLWARSNPNLKINNQSATSNELPATKT